MKRGVEIRCGSNHKRFHVQRPRISHPSRRHAPWRLPRRRNSNVDTVRGSARRCTAVPVLTPLCASSGTLHATPQRKCGTSRRAGGIVEKMTGRPLFLLVQSPSRIPIFFRPCRKGTSCAMDTARPRTGAKMTFSGRTARAIGTEAQGRSMGKRYCRQRETIGHSTSVEACHHLRGPEWVLSGRTHRTRAEIFVPLGTLVRRNDAQGPCAAVVDDGESYVRGVEL